MGPIRLQNIPVYKRVKILGRGGNCIFFKTAITKFMLDLKRQETGNNQLS